MAGASVMRYEMPIWVLIVLYFPPTFFLSSLCALLGIICRQEHIATLVCGVIWLIILLTRSLLRFPGLDYVYLFIRFAGDQNNIWLWNKGIITLAGLFLWCVIYWKCKRVDWGIRKINVQNRRWSIWEVYNLIFRWKRGGYLLKHCDGSFRRLRFLLVSSLG